MLLKLGIDGMVERGDAGMWIIFRKSTKVI